MNDLANDSKDTESTIPFPKVEDETPKANDKRKPSGGHKRSISGNLLARLNILRSSDGEGSDAEGTERASPVSASRSAMSEALSNKSNRKRKGSLRKVVLGRGRDRKGSERKSPLLSPKLVSTEATIPPLPESEDTTEEAETPRPNRGLAHAATPDVPPRWPFQTLSRVSIPSIRSSVASFDPISSTASILTSPTLPTDSTEDDDELQIPKLVAARQIQPLQPPPKKPGAAADSYFPIQSGINRLIRQPSPLSSSSANVSSSPDEDTTSSSDEWDYSETAWWGYIILIVTWIVFVVGMGSCFGVWSWAWDVGETPYAPPELEDDPTLPIVGYYPALLVLTCIMAWVWVVVAWVGMKYFRHADLGGDDK